jgi:hypothetical protein
MTATQALLTPRDTTHPDLVDAAANNTTRVHAKTTQTPTLAAIPGKPETSEPDSGWLQQ